MDARRAAVEAVAQHCDVLDRIELVPPSAQMRGLYFRSIERVLSASGKLGPYRALFAAPGPALGWQPMREFLLRLAVAGGILAGPANVSRGMFEIGRGNAAAFAESLIGRTLLRFLSHDPRNVLQQALAGRRQSARPSRWQLSFPSERSAEMSMIEEYAYLDSYLLGAAYGTFAVIGLPVQIECVLENRFCGKHIFHW